MSQGDFFVFTKPTSHVHSPLPPSRSSVYVSSSATPLPLRMISTPSLPTKVRITTPPANCLIYAASLTERPLYSLCIKSPHTLQSHHAHISPLLASTLNGIFSGEIIGSGVVHANWSDGPALVLHESAENWKGGALKGGAAAEIAFWRDQWARCVGSMYSILYSIRFIVK